ncbi:hypothetical protein B0J12DRAFT_78504 [Macrophomina phaseolina]|uniref:AB hydrolase-1 domain-containing protein n=1 Tax=Macrophomina phaseolina TaxID=35725 RepID=A0ABQ8GBM6_9PEZI|nr:hypothetical protein B0J12DRAFT_78504 [Macrophomina phaseolina]
MIGTSTREYIFIRACIFLLRAITPACISYCALRFLSPARLRAPVALELWAACETLFFFFFYIPRKQHLQAAAVHPPLASRQERRLLFDRCSSHVPDHARYLRGWFMGAPLSEIKRDNLNEFLAWAFFNTGHVNTIDPDELDEYIREIEKQLGREVEPGRGNARCVRLTIDKVDMSHRSLLWYMVVLFVDIFASVRLWHFDFDYYGIPLRQYFSVFPLRPHDLTASKRSPSSTFTYWHRPHRSSTKLPILFIHGIGIGLYPYVDFLSDVNASDNDEVGIIAIEIMPISFRIAPKILGKDAVCVEINQILKRHGWDKFVLASHSYGSVISTHLLHHPDTAAKIASALFVDPVTFLLHLPDVAYNFTTRKPSRANERQLSYFASKDMGVSHTLSRCFFWSENILWKDDLAGRDVTVVLSGKDLIVDTETVGRYLAGRDLLDGDGSWKQSPWSGKGLEVLWFEHLDHAQVFDRPRDRAKLVKVLQEYCGRS